MQRSYPAPLHSACVLCALLATVAASSLLAHSSAKRPPAAQGSTGPARSARLKVRGTIQAYDAATTTLSLKTPNGAVELSLPPTTHISRGTHTLPASELHQLSGYRATVRYSDSNGVHTAESVHVFDREPRTDR